MEEGGKVRKNICLSIVVLVVVCFCLVLPGCKRGSSASGVTTSFDGTVKIKVSDSSAWRAVNKNENIKVGMTIQTASNGSGSIGFKDEALIRLAPDTEVKIQSFNDTGDSKEINLMINKGDTFSSVDEDNWKYAVETPVAVMGVIGTDFRITVDEITGTTRVACFTGMVSVEKDGEVIHLAPKLAVNITHSGISKPERVIMFKESFNGNSIINMLNKVSIEQERTLDSKSIETE